MAKMFGLFDFQKEGPGVEKTTKKENSVKLFFRLFFQNFFRFMLINTVYVLMCLPIVTHGMANAGITNVTRNIARQKHSFGISDFFETIRKNIKQSLAVGVINTVITALIAFAVWFYFQDYRVSGGMLSLGGLAISLSIAIVYVTMNFYIYTLMITFDFSIKALYKNSLKFAMLNLPKNILCGVIILLVLFVYLAIGWATLDMRVWLIELLVFIQTFPAFSKMLIQFFTFGSIKKHIIDPYYAEHPDLDIEKRRNLGLEIPEEDEDDDYVSWE